MGCRITKGVTEQCMVRLRLTILNLELFRHAKLEDTHLNLGFVSPCMELDEKEKGHTWDAK